MAVRWRLAPAALDEKPCMLSRQRALSKGAKVTGGCLVVSYSKVQKLVSESHIEIRRNDENFMEIKSYASLTNYNWSGDKSFKANFGMLTLGRRYY